MKFKFLLLLFIPFIAFAESMYSPTWGFSLDLPEGYEFVDGDGRDRFSFSGPAGLQFDLVVYNGIYNTMNEMVNDVNRRLSNKGSIDFFTYRGKQAAVIELDFQGSTGWALCLMLTNKTVQQQPMLLALSYNPADGNDLNLFHMSALDSISPTIEDLNYPGPIMEYSFPRGEARRKPLAINGLSAMIYDNDAEASQILIEREFNVLINYSLSPNLPDAWIRYYRFIYRDSWDRISDAASVLIKHWFNNTINQNEAKLLLAKEALVYVQNFEYERDFSGSDFLNLVSAVTEGRGDCDSRAMLWAIILAHAEIRTAMMVSIKYSHAMGLVDIEGAGARFDAYGTRWLVAETTANVDLGLIAQDMSDNESWLGIIFE
jgi:hypothetical protein